LWPRKRRLPRRGAAGAEPGRAGSGRARTVGTPKTCEAPVARPSCRDPLPRGQRRAAAGRADGNGLPRAVRRGDAASAAGRRNTS